MTSTAPTDSNFNKPTVIDEVRGNNTIWLREVHETLIYSIEYYILKNLWVMCQE